MKKIVLAITESGVLIGYYTKEGQCINTEMLDIAEDSNVKTLVRLV